MIIDKKNYKSLVFSLLKDKLLDKTKKQTYRTSFIPKYKINEIIAIAFRDRTKKDPEKEFLYLAKVKDLYPRKLADLTLKEAQRDGFESIEEMQEKIMELNKIKNLEQWGFITLFEPIKQENTNIKNQQNPMTKFF